MILMIDTCVCSRWMRRDNYVHERLVSWLRNYSSIHMSAVSVYEIKKGLMMEGPTRKMGALSLEMMHALDDFSPLPILDIDMLRAADIYVDLERKGLRIGDADCIIAAQALARNVTLATFNTSHFNRVAGLNLDAW